MLRRVLVRKNLFWQHPHSFFVTNIETSCHKVCVAGCKMYPYLSAQINICKTWHLQTRAPAKEQTSCQHGLAWQCVPLKVLNLPNQPWIAFISMSSLQSVIFGLAGHKICLFPLLILEPLNQVRNRDRWGTTVSAGLWLDVLFKVALDWLSTKQSGTAESLAVIKAFIDLWLLWQLWWSPVLFWGDCQWWEAALGPDQTGQRFECVVLCVQAASSSLAFRWTLWSPWVALTLLQKQKCTSSWCV